MKTTQQMRDSNLKALMPLISLTVNRLMNTQVLEVTVAEAIAEIEKTAVEYKRHKFMKHAIWFWDCCTLSMKSDAAQMLFQDMNSR